MKIFHGDKNENFGPGPFMAPSESQGRPRRADWHPKHFHTVCLDGTHPYHALGPLLGPLLHSRAPKGPFGGPRGSWRAPGGQIWSQPPPIGLTGLESWLPHTLAWYWAFSWPQGTHKGPVFAQNAPFGGPGGPRRVRRGHFWSQLT